MEKAALITGGSRGLGKTIALMLGRAGYYVVVNYLKSENEAQEVVRALPRAIAIKADVSDPEQVGQMATEVKREFGGGLDVLVNNAGITKDSLLLKTSEAGWDAAIRTNLRGCFNTVKALAPLMIDSGGGHIVNISSRSGLRGKAGQAAYSASKAALLGMTFSLAAELSEYDIKVNVVLPGYMPTEMGGAAQDAMNKAKKESLLGRLSDPEDIAKFILWLVGTKNISGQVFTLDSRL